MKAIETRYKGYRFRSRLEARWAVFFDALGVKYEYESEGFDLDGQWYLPDFWVPEWDCWVEIKPAISNEALGLPLSLANSAINITEGGAIKRGQEVLLIAGSPWPRDHEVLVLPYSTWDGETWSFNEFSRCRGCDSIVLLYTEDGEPMAEFSLGKHTQGCDGFSKFAVSVFDDFHAEIMGAYRSARAARFEHGEMP